jgi:vitamin K-dependent gamma-carboxylase-like protein
VVSPWSRFWFAPASPVDLGVSRLFFFAGVFAIYAREDFSAWGAVSDAFWLPLPLFTILHLKPLSPDVLGALQAVWRVALLLGAIGLFSRTSAIVASVLGVYLLGLPHNFGQTYHFDAVLVIAMCILACSRAGDACSLDAWLKDDAGLKRSGEYTWPIRAIWVAISLVFFGAGLAKLRYGGLAWIASDNMSILLTRALYHASDADPLTRAGLWIAAHPWLARALAAAAVATEVAFPAALFSRRARLVLVPAAMAMLIAIRLLMGPTFGGFLIVNVFWVPWHAVPARVETWVVQRRRHATKPATIDS